MPTDDVDLVVDVMLLTAAAQVGRQAIARADRGVDESNTYGLPAGEAMAEVLREWFRSQKKRVLAKVPKPGGAIPGDLAQLGEDDQAMARAVAPVIAAQWSSSGKSTYAQLGLDPEDWRVTSPHLRAKIEHAALSFCSSTNATTGKSIDVALAALRASFLAGVIDEGETLQQLTKRVGEIFEHAETYRARRIAATETSRAVHAAQLQAAADSEVVAGYEWLVSGDACPLCRKVAAEARRVRLGDDFAVIGTHPEYSKIKHPPLHPGCQCTVVEILKPEYGGPADPQWAETLVQPKVPKDGYTPPEGVKEPRPNKKKASNRPKPKPRAKPAPPPKLEPAPPPAPVVAPEPIPVLPPTPPPPPPAAARASVAGSLDVRLTGPLRAKADRAIAAIDAVHGVDPPPARIPVYADPKLRGNGGLLVAPGNRPVAVALNPAGETPILTTIHEIGHLLDLDAIPRAPGAGGKRDWERDPIMGPWLEAVRRTEAIQKLRRDRDLLDRRHPPGSRPADVRRAIEYLDYLTSPVEMWARSYSQYVAARDGGADLAAEVRGLQPGGSGPYIATQWYDEDFGPVGRAVGRVLESLGWHRS